MRVTDQRIIDQRDPERAFVRCAAGALHEHRRDCFISEHGVVDAGLLIQATGANRNTLKDNLRRLVERGLLEKSGQRRGTRYRLATVDVAKPAVLAETTSVDES